MRRTIIFRSFLLILIPFTESKAQTISGRTTYLHASAGLARSEDGLRFLSSYSASQWTPMLNVGLGHRFNRNIGLEAHAATMLTRLNAEGMSVSNNQKTSVAARHSNLMAGLKLFAPMSDRFEMFIRASIGVLFSRSAISSDTGPAFEKSTSNLGYMIAFGFAYRVGNKAILTMQFDFSDPYGSENVWSGDMGLLNIGVIIPLQGPSGL